MRSPTEVWRSTFTRYHAKQRNWPIWRKTKHGTKEQDPNLTETRTDSSHDLNVGMTKKHENYVHIYQWQERKTNPDMLTARHQDTPTNQDLVLSFIHVKHLWSYLLFRHSSHDGHRMKDFSPQRSFLHQNNRFYVILDEETVSQSENKPDTSGISGVMVTLNKCIERYIPPIMRRSRLWRGLPWVFKPCWERQRQQLIQNSSRT